MCQYSTNSFKHLEPTISMYMYRAQLLNPIVNGETVSPNLGNAVAFLGNDEFIEALCQELESREEKGHTLNSRLDAALQTYREQAQSLVDSGRLVLSLEAYSEPCEFDQAIQQHTTRITELKKQLAIVERRVFELTVARDSAIYDCVCRYEENLAAQNLVAANQERSRQVAQQRRQVAEAKAHAAQQPSPSSQPQASSSSVPSFDGSY